MRKNNLKNRNILLGVTGSIAAYKSCELVRRLRESGAKVRVILTAAAEKFVGETTFLTLSQNPIIKELFCYSENWVPQHISLSQWAEILVIAPATANIIGKVASGIADEILSTTILSRKCPVLFAPAMNQNMFENSIVQKNIEKLKKLGYHFIEPEVGYLACGYEGKGRLANIEKIIRKISALLPKK